MNNKQQEPSSGRSLGQGQIDDSGLDGAFHTPRYSMPHHSPTRADRKSLSPERTLLRRDMAARRPVRVSRSTPRPQGDNDKRIQEKLDARRSQQNKPPEAEAEDSGIEDGPDKAGSTAATANNQGAAAAPASSSRQAEQNIDSLSRLTVVTFPHYEVADEAANQIDSSLLLQEIEDTLVLTRSQSFKTTARNKHHGLIDTELETDLLRRHVDARRSYNTRKKGALAILPNKVSVTRGQSVDNLEQSGIDERPMAAGRPPSATSSGFNAGKNSTKGSVVGPILDIEPVDTTKMSGLVGERRKNSNRLKESKDPASNPGISNSTQMLIQSKMNTQFFSFPDISPSEQRKAGCTPRNEERPPRSPTRAKQRGKRSPQDPHFPIKEHPSTISELDKTEHSTPRNSGVRNGETSSLDPTGQRKSSRDRYSRMIALGLPKVNIDIDRNHFSRQSLKRRSLQLRERYDMSGTAQDPSEPMPQQNQPTVAEHVGDDMMVESIDPHTEQEEHSTIIWSAIEDESSVEINRVTESNKPVESVSGMSVNGSSDVGLRLDKRHAQRSSISSGGGVKEPVGVSYYKMGQPGNNKKDGQMTLMDPPASPRYRQVYQGDSQVPPL